ncbi:hypothetical protein ABH973_006710 [Bradyrhizobium ottawaense]|uniref:hypothetical protein n=1 Tax=Bradyrhizobium ottawaense TaxID=931866 RepID=UPI00351885FE
MQDVWYVLEDGRTVDPNECSTDEGGVLRHESGVAVKMRSPGVPLSRGVDAAKERVKADRAEARAKAEAEAKAKAAKDMKPGEGNPPYKTR